MLSVHGIPLALQVVLPMVLVAWQTFRPPRSIFDWLIRAAWLLFYLTATHVAGLWLVLPWYTAFVLMMAVILIAAGQYRTARRLPWRTRRLSWFSIAGCTALAVMATAILAGAIAGRRIPAGGIVDLELPVAGGTYFVANGGSTTLVNAHVGTLTAERFRAYRGQSYGVDLVKLGRFGLRAAGMLPTDPGRYEIYGETLYSPCSGVVLRAGDGAPDMPPPRPDRTHMLGNYVVVECRGVHVLVGHLQRGSVTVSVGQRVARDSVLGRIGNSGNTNEPHLHIHAQRPAAAGAEPFSGDPLPMRLGGRFLVRNDRLFAPPR
jgi:hypothetical protein